MKNAWKKVKNSKKWWIETMKELFDRPDIDNLYQFWLNVYEKISNISSIREQSDLYHQLTNHLNPAQLMQCDFYRILKTFESNNFEILQIKENLGRYCAGQSCLNASGIFCLIIKKRPWIVKVRFSDDYDCVAGIFRPEIILNMDDNREYQGEYFYAYNSAEYDTLCMIRMFEVGYEQNIGRKI